MFICNRHSRILCDSICIAKFCLLKWDLSPPLYFLFCYPCLDKLSTPQATALVKLPGLRPSTAPEGCRPQMIGGGRSKTEMTNGGNPTITLRLTAPSRRHMMEAFPLYNPSSANYETSIDSAWHERIKNATEKHTTHVLLQPR